MEPVKEVEEYSLSDEDLRQLLNTTNVVPYPDLKKYRTLEDALDDQGRLIVLYLTSPQEGHWCCLWRGDDGVHYFDPYGKRPEEPKTWLTRNQNWSLGQASNELMRLLKGCGCPVYYNKISYQSENPDINTCGRHVASRLIMKDLSDKQYYDIVKDADMSSDDFVSYATYILLGK
jgi:hypothetical protein